MSESRVATLKAIIRGLLPRQSRAHRIKFGPLRGHRIVTSWHDYPAAIIGYTETPLLRWLENIVGAGETWLDIGAHYGYTALALCRLVGPTGRVIAFEPVLPTAGALASTKRVNRLDNLLIVPLGLSSERNLIRQQVALERGMATSTGGPLRTDSEDIWTIGFDSLASSLDVKSVDGVKIDVQGMELEVLLGMRSLLRTGPLLAVEFHPGVDRPAVLQVLVDAGYALPGQAIDPLSGETEARYADHRSYVFDRGMSREHRPGRSSRL